MAESFAHVTLLRLNPEKLGRLATFALCAAKAVNWWCAMGVLGRTTKSASLEPLATNTKKEAIGIAKIVAVEPNL